VTGLALAGLAILLCSCVYLVLSIIAVKHQFPPNGGNPAPRAKHADATSSAVYNRPGISVLKPLAGAEPGLASNLRSFFEQDYPCFELLFAVRSAADAAIPVVTSLQREYPQVASRLIVTGEPPYANAKVFSLSQLTVAARYQWLVMSDSDIRVSSDFLEQVSAELESDKFDLATCPYRAVSESSFWAYLEALGANTEFWSSAFVAKMMEGVRFTIGPTVIARCDVFNRIPWDSLSSYLAEDFVLGQRAAELGFRVDLSRIVVEHHLSDESFWSNMSHRLRWARSTRRSRPWGYLGQVFTNPIPIAVLVLVINPTYWPALAAAAVLRIWGACVTTKALGMDIGAREISLLPVQDLLSFGFWIAGFTGNSIAWRGRRYRLNRDGTFEAV
jgi:ceramide glucosyltransferase